MNETPGFIGLGSIGQPMAESLLKAGYGLKVYNRTASKTEPLIAQGAEAVSLPEAVAQAGGIVVSDDAALQDSVKHTGFLERLGSGGIAPSLHRMRVHEQKSTQSGGVPTLRPPSLVFPRQQHPVGYGFIRPGHMPRKRLRKGVEVYLDECLKERALKALLLDARLQAPLTEAVQQRQREFATLTSVDFQVLGWPDANASARLFTVLVAEVALVELETGRNEAMR